MGTLEYRENIRFALEHRYAQGELGDSDCPDGYTFITSETECETALTALDLCHTSQWTGSYTLIPVGCSHRPNYCGSHDWHWNTATSGSGRSDTRPVCVKEETETDYCTEGIVLSSISDTSCNLAGCSEGYKSSGTATVSCPIGGGSLEYDFTCT